MPLASPAPKLSSLSLALTPFSSHITYKAHYNRVQYRTRPSPEKMTPHLTQNHLHDHFHPTLPSAASRQLPFSPPITVLLLSPSLQLCSPVTATELAVFRRPHSTILYFITLLYSPLSSLFELNLRRMLRYSITMRETAQSVPT